MKRIDKYIIDMIEKKYDPSVIKYNLNVVGQLSNKIDKVYFELLQHPSFKYLVTHNIIRPKSEFDIMSVYGFICVPEIKSGKIYTEAKYFTLEDGNLHIFAFVLKNNRILIVRDLYEVGTDYYKRFYETKEDVYNEHIFHEMLEFDSEGDLNDFLYCKQIIKLSL